MIEKYTYIVKKNTLFRIVLLFLPLLFLNGCASYVKKIDFQPAREVPAGISPTPIMFKGAEFLVPPGQDVGYGSTGSFWCSWPRYPVSRTDVMDVIDPRYLKERFRNTLESNGYDVVGGLDLEYNEEDEDLRAEYTISAKIKGTQVDICQNDLDNIAVFFSTRGGVNGEVYLSIDWSVYDPIRRTVVYQTTTEGYTKRNAPNHEGMTVMVHDAFAMAAHNLGTDEDFYNLIVNGIKPLGWRSKRLTREIDNFDARRIFDPAEHVTIHQNALSREAFTTDIETKRKHAVMIQKIGHGSGFFISDQGHILTNAHVVGDALRMRVVTANKADTLSAEVLRVNKARDVALLKLEEIPEDLDIVTLPIRSDIPSIGEDVYVLGTPKYYSKMQDTLTHGVVSAYREKLKFHGIRANFIQSDVEVHSGNSGGPMYDANGNVIGITVLGVAMNENNTGNGLNLFIPINEALRALDIDIR